MKKCPFCAEEIQDEAVKCRHCGSALTEAGRHTAVDGFWKAVVAIGFIIGAAILIAAIASK